MEDYSIEFFLLGQIDSYSGGQGTINLLVPVKAIKDAGLRVDSWKKMQFTILQLPKGEYYDVPGQFGIFGLIPVLEGVANCTWEQAQDTANKYAGSKAGREKE